VRRACRRATTQREAFSRRDVYAAYVEQRYSGAKRPPFHSRFSPASPPALRPSPSPDDARHAVSVRSSPMRRSIPRCNQLFTVIDAHCFTRRSRKFICHAICCAVRRLPTMRCTMQKMSHHADVLMPRKSDDAEMPLICVCAYARPYASLCRMPVRHACPRLHVDAYTRRAAGVLLCRYEQEFLCCSLSLMRMPQKEVRVREYRQVRAFAMRDRRQVMKVASGFAACRAAVACCLLFFPARCCPATPGLPASWMLRRLSGACVTVVVHRRARHCLRGGANFDMPCCQRDAAFHFR